MKRPTLNFLAIFLCFSKWAVATTMEVPYGNIDDDKQWKFSAGVAYSLGSQLKFHEVERTGVGGNSSATMQVANAFSLNADLRYLPQQSWGFVGAIGLDMPRKIRSGSYSGAAWGIQYTGEGDKITVMTLAASAAYRWQEVYMPFGFNISGINYETAGGSAVSNTAKGGIGVQYGVGAYVQENIALELMGRSTSVKLSSEEAGVRTEYRKGYLTSLSFGVKYIF